MAGAYFGNTSQSVEANGLLAYTLLVATPGNTVTTNGSSIMLVDAGIYKISYHLNFVATTDNQNANVVMRRNGAVIASSNALSFIAGTGQFENIGTSIYVNASAGDFITLTNNSGSTTTITELAITVEKLS
jgi:hypothetical protein